MHGKHLLVVVSPDFIHLCFFIMHFFGDLHIQCCSFFVFLILFVGLLISVVWSLFYEVDIDVRCHLPSLLSFGLFKLNIDVMLLNHLQSLLLKIFVSRIFLDHLVLCLSGLILVDLLNVFSILFSLHYLLFMVHDVGFLDEWVRNVIWAQVLRTVYPLEFTAWAKGAKC